MKLLAASFLALAACSNAPRTWSESDIQDIATDAAVDASVDMESRLADLEATVKEQEREIESLQTDLDFAEQHIENLYSAHGIE